MFLKLCTFTFYSCLCLVHVRAMKEKRNDKILIFWKIHNFFEQFSKYPNHLQTSTSSAKRKIRKKYHLSNERASAFGLPFPHKSFRTFEDIRLPIKADLLGPLPK